MWISWIIIGVDPKRMRGVSPSRKQSSKLQLRVSNCLPWKIHEWFSYTKKLIVPTDPVCCPDTQMLCWMMLLLMRILSDNSKLNQTASHEAAMEFLERQRWDAGASFMGFSFIWLVVWNMFFTFPYIGNSHPNWPFLFSEGLEPPSSFGCPIVPL